MDKPWHSQSIDEVLSILKTRENGLYYSEVFSRLMRYGLNKISISKPFSLWKLFFHQFANPLILILILASGIKMVISSLVDGSVLLLTVIVMVLIGFLQEMKAERAMQSLKRLASHKSKVRREGRTELILSEELVPGDILLLEMGDKVPADARLLEVTHLKINESMLTGESLLVEKQIEPIENNCVVADRTNMVYEGTVVAFGKGSAVIVQTGIDTELGKIAKNIESIQPEPTPLQKQISSVSKEILMIIFWIVLLLGGVSFYQGMSLVDIFLLCIAAAVSAIPEGLPAAFTVTLAAGMHLMAKKNVIARKLIAVETLGATSTICSDKTGTLTLNQMTVMSIFSLEKNFDLYRNHRKSREFSKLSKDPVCRKILEIGVLCNDSSISEEKGNLETVGDPMESALLIAARNNDISLDSLLSAYPRLYEIPFISENLYMATLNRTKNGQIAYIKGAPERLLAFSSHALFSDGIRKLDNSMHDQIKEAIDLMTKKALRPLAVAYCELQGTSLHLTEEDFKGKLVFSGIFGLIDPPRPEAIESIEVCKKAGIRVVMITGDHPSTALIIAKQLGIPTAKALSGKELNELNDEELFKKTKDVSVFARVEPSHKLRIVRAFQSHGDCVAMTGDGVNDAPALEAANIGIAMGLSGTDIAKEAADIILTNDRFDSIVIAVEEGRAILNRLRNVCALLLTTCFGELLALVLCVLVTKLSPLIPIQILWINLVSGSLIAIPLGLEPKTGHEMKEPPHDPSSKLIYPGMIHRIAFIASLLGLSSFFVFLLTYKTFSLEKARTITLSSLLIFEWLLALHMCSQQKMFAFLKNSWLLISLTVGVMLHLCILYIPFIAELFHTTPLSPSEWLLSLISGVSVFCLEALRKRLLPDLFNTGR